MFQVETPITVKTERKLYGVSTVGHCIFCLRRVTSNNEEATPVDNSNSTPEWTEGLQNVPCAYRDSLSYKTKSTSTALLSTLNKSWNYLKSGGHWDWDDRNAGQHSVEFTSLPVMCQFCVHHLDTVCDLMGKLMGEINKLGSIMRNSKSGGVYSWRGDMFERVLKDSSFVEYQCVIDTLEFLGIPNSSGLAQPLGNSLSWSSSFTGLNEEPERLETPAETEGSSSFISTNDPNTELTEEKSFRSELNFHDEASEDDEDTKMQNYDSNNDDPDYIKEEDYLSSQSEYSDSSTEDLGEDPLGDSSAEKFKLAQKDLPYVVEPRSAPTQPHNPNLVTSPTENATSIITPQATTSNGNTYNCPVEGYHEVVEWPESVKMHQQTVNKMGGIPKHVLLKLKTLANTSIEGKTFVVTPNDKGKKIYTCIIDGCGKKFAVYATGLELHQVKQHNLDNNPYKVTCPICSIQLTSEGRLRRHITTHNKTKVTFQTCDLCIVKVPRKEIYEHVRAHVGEEYLFKCPNFSNCSSVFCLSSSLMDHLRICASCRKATPDVEKYLTVSLVCEVCGEPFTNLLALRCHLSRHHEIGTKSFPCPIPTCPQRFCVRQSVVLHIYLHKKKLEVSEGKDQECDVCKETVKPEEMEKHLQDTHHVQEIIKCAHCPFLFSTREHLIDHMYEHRHIGLFCDICGDRGATFYKLDHLRKHYFTVHQIGRKFLCKHCDKEFYSNRGLEGHLTKSHTAVPEKNDITPNTSKAGNVPSKKMFKCDECDGVEYKLKTSLTEHKIKYHGAEHLKCNYCEEKFPNFTSRGRHEMEHRGTVGKEKYPCQVAGCGKVYSTKAMLKQHISYQHDGVKSNVCEQCGKAYPSKGSLKIHIESVHMDLRNQVCDICGESFTNASVLKRHKLIHTGERPFECDLCGQRFRHKEVLTKHLEGHKKKGSNFKPNGPMKQIRKRVETKKS